MPYRGAADPDLPKAVRKLPKALRELWVKVFNANYDPQDEGRAFRVAWGVVRKVRTAKKAKFVPAEDAAAMRAWLREQRIVAKVETEQYLRIGASFGVKMQADGRVRWTMISSGAFEDRDHQIVSSAYLQSALAFAAKTGYKGSLNFWHIKHSDIGRCDFQLLVGEPPVLVESGLFDETPAASRAAQYYLKHAVEQGGSIEFLWTDLTPDGVFNPPGVIVRRSVLPRQYASFPWSGLLVKEHKMSKTRPEQIAEFAKVIGVTPEEAEQMIEQIESGAKELADYGVRWKEIQAADAEPESAENAPQAEESSEQPAEPAEKSTATDEGAAQQVENADGDQEEAAEIEVVLTPETLSAIIEQVSTGITERFQTAISTLEERIQTLDGGLAEFDMALKAISASVKAYEAKIEALQVADDEKIAQAVRDLPRATVKNLTAAQRPTQREAEAVSAESMLERGIKTLHG